MDEDFEIQVISTENFPPGLGGASTFCGGIHYIFINANLPAELQQSALEQEKMRKTTD